ncbi:adenine deaminase [Winogradskyella aurantiaca]|uniref:adenine deaminase n=1 Tax=Winogradskyella aurantiaca TaxID=2219558 RepID=UPI000E1C925B|nr:adenine deaminase [Winogradskyella aurantiaca]
MKIQGQIVDIRNRKIFPGEIIIIDGYISDIIEIDSAPQTYILPGFIDAHIHIESSMLVPSEFAKIAVNHGTVATVSDPHEIANVLGVQGVEFMIENGKTVPFKFNFGAPSCVPATSFETAGATIDAKGIKALLQKPEILYLAEMMNYPGVIYKDEEVLEKINWAQSFNKPVDGHAPGLRGADLDAYIAAGISTDHECFTYEEALEKLEKGMKILIREGSAAKNFNALIDLLPDHFQNMMFCSDDKHPDELLVGHINQLVVRAISRGLDLFKVLEVACLNPVDHYNLDVGTLRVGDNADFILVKDIEFFEVLQTYINGELVSDEGRSLITSSEFEVLNNFSTSLKQPEDFEINGKSNQIKAIECLEGQLITNCLSTQTMLVGGNLISDISNDILKIAVINRYSNAKPSVAFIKNFGLKDGAIASSVAHDSHNIVVVGVDDISICKAVNLIIESKGGLSAVSNDNELVMPLPVAGIMSNTDAKSTGEAYAQLDQMAKSLGSQLNAPYMTLSFMALLVIPSLKLSDLGLFDGTKFQFTSLESI